MLEEIKIAGEASYTADGETLGDLRQLNFIYGANGSGKTTISRVIATPADYANCSVTWTNGRPLEALVYNRDFVERNYVSQMRGIFTLGEEDATVLANIAAFQARCAQLDSEISNRVLNLQGADGQSGKRGELAGLRRALEDACWQIKTRHDEQFKDAFAGFRGARSTFCDKLLTEFRDNRARSDRSAIQSVYGV